MDYNLDLWDYYNSDAIDAIRLISAILNMRHDLGPTALYYSPLTFVGPVIFRDRGKVAEFAELPT